MEAKRRTAGLAFLLTLALCAPSCVKTENAADSTSPQPSTGLDCTKDDPIDIGTGQDAGTSSETPEPSCQNSPPPSYCKGGVAAIVASGKGADGCTIWTCKEPYLVLDDAPSAEDTKIAQDLQAFLTQFSGDEYVFALKRATETTRQDLSGRVTVLIHDQKALIINLGIDYGIVIHDHPVPGSPDKCALTTFLAEIMQPTAFVIQRDSTQVSYDDLRAEMYKDCKKAGETWEVKPSTRYNVCCKGLAFLPVTTYVPPGSCSRYQGIIGCSDCGNAVCEPWENSCNCPEDCS